LETDVEDTLQFLDDSIFSEKWKMVQAKESGSMVVRKSISVLSRRH
jgi:hypothetical protein